MTPTPSIGQDLSLMDNYNKDLDILSTSIVEDEGSLEVCYHVKEAWNIFELFHTRYTLHKRAYQHRVAGKSKYCCNHTCHNGITQAQLII